MGETGWLGDQTAVPIRAKGQLAFPRGEQSDAANAWIAQKYNAGQSMRDIAAQLDVSYPCVERRVTALHWKGLVQKRPPGGPRRPWTKLIPGLAALPRLEKHTRLYGAKRTEVKAQIAPVYNDGAPIEAIAKQLNRSPGGVRILLTEMAKEGLVRYPRPGPSIARWPAPEQIRIGRGPGPRRARRERGGDTPGPHDRPARHAAR
ncbi:MAG: hypothetical protein V7607_5422 [Solirubrobacteraceae bacterium]